MNLKNICTDTWTQTHVSPIDKFVYNQQQAMPFCPMLWHEELAIIKVQQGSCTFLVDGTRQILSFGDIMILKPFALYTLAEGENLVLHCCMVNLRTLQHAKNNLTYLASASIDCVIHSNDEKYVQLTQALKQLDQDANHEYMSLIDVQNILHLLHSNKVTAQNITDDKHLFTIKNVVNVLHTQTAQIVVNEIAEQCGYSEFYLMKLFKHYVGHAMVDYANNYRLIQCALQICTTNKDFCQIAQKVGYSNISYFNRQFKRLFDTTPKQMRKNYQNK